MIEPAPTSPARTKRPVLRRRLRVWWQRRLRPRHPRALWWSLAHAVWMLLMTYVWLGLPYAFGNEAFLTKWTALFKKELLGFDAKPPPDAVLFVDVSRVKTIIEIENGAETPTPGLIDRPTLGTRKLPVTDRAPLAALLDLLAAYRDETALVVLDVLLEHPTPADSSLQAALMRLGDKVLSASRYSADGTRHIAPVVEVTHALGSYRSAAGMFVKYPLMERERTTLPAAMYERLSGRKVRHRGLLYLIGSRPSFRAPIVDFKVRPADFRAGTDRREANFAVHDLETLLVLGRVMTPEDRRALFAGKMIMIGDFESDQHLTPLGYLPGLLVVYNAYLTLAHGEAFVPPGWVVLLLVSYGFISYRVFTEKKVTLPYWLRRHFTSGFGAYLMNSLDEVFFLALLTILSYLLFNLHIGIIFLFLYLKLLEFILAKFNVSFT
ncbi:MAG: hypothetical protein WBA12_03340 [Catalinimonas sp.]